MDRRNIKVTSIRQQQVQQPLFEFSGACAGCGETPYIKLVSQLFGDRTIVANATGCSSIYGGNHPTTPWSFNADGRGPAWSNSLFEDNAEFGMGMRVALDKQDDFARELVAQLAAEIGADLAERSARTLSRATKRPSTNSASGSFCSKHVWKHSTRRRRVSCRTIGRRAGRNEPVDHRRRRLGL